MISWMYTHTQSAYSSLLTQRSEYCELFRSSWYRSLILAKARIAYLGSENTVVRALNPQQAVMVSRAAAQHEGITVTASLDDLKHHEPFDYIIISASYLSLYPDYKQLLFLLRRLTIPTTRVLIEQTTTWGRCWEDTTTRADLSGRGLQLGLKALGFTIVTQQTGLMLPFWIPGISWLCNSFLGSLPLLKRLGTLRLITARVGDVYAGDPARRGEGPSVSVIIPCKNERGTVEHIIQRTPVMGASIELLFVEGNSSDGTFAELQRLQKIYPRKQIRIMSQTGRGKRNATVEGCAAATGEILMILDGDMTVDPEELVYFYDAIASNRGDMINGTRLCLPMEKKAMQHLNWIGNHTFAWLLSWITGQRLTDTLCGTKVFWKRDYEMMIHNNPLWDADPFGDFALLIGAMRLAGTIIEIPVFYRARRYGTSQIHRFYNAAQLLRLTLYAWKEQCIRS